MQLKEFIDMFDNHNGITVVNDSDLNCIAKGKTSDIAERTDLHNKEVVAFGFYDNELCVRVLTEKPFTCNDCPFFYADSDENDEPERCHYQGVEGEAPCSYEPPEEVNWEEYCD